MTLLVLVFSLLIQLGLTNDSPVQFSDPSSGFSKLLTLGGQKGHELQKVESIATDQKGTVFVTDMASYSIRRFSSRGEEQFGTLQHESRLQGFERGPSLISVWNDTLAVVDDGTPTVNLFTSDLKFVNKLKAPSIVTDIAFDGMGRIYLATLEYNTGVSLAIYDKRGKVVADIPLKNRRGDRYFDAFCMTVDRQGSLLIAFLYVNRIEILDPLGRQVKEFSVPGVPAEAGKMRSDNPALAGVPTGALFRSIATDGKGHIFLLAADISRNRYQDVYVLNYDGKLLSTAKLPERTGLLHVDQEGNFLTRDMERRSVKKYKFTLKQQ